MVKFTFDFTNMILSVKDSVFNELLTERPLLFLPRTQGKYTGDIVSSFEKIFRVFLETTDTNNILKLATEKKAELLNKLESEGKLNLEDSLLLNQKDSFFVTKRFECSSYLFTGDVIVNNPLEYLPNPGEAGVFGLTFLLTSAKQHKKNQHMVPKIKKNGLIRDINKSRTTASTKALDEENKDALKKLSELKRKL